MTKIEFTTMVMIKDIETDRFLVQNRVKSWKGVAFPGGHVEKNESLIDCAVREIREETGLDIWNLKHCGVIHWLNNKTFERYLVFLYETIDFSGELLSKSDEGDNLWMTKAELLSVKGSENGFERYLPMFFKGEYSEAFGLWNDEEEWDLEYK